MSVTVPTSMPATSVIALSGPGSPGRGIPSPLARGRPSVVCVCDEVTPLSSTPSRKCPTGGTASRSGSAKLQHHHRHQDHSNGNDVDEYPDGHSDARHLDDDIGV